MCTAEVVSFRLISYPEEKSSAFASTRINGAARGGDAEDDMGY